MTNPAPPEPGQRLYDAVRDMGLLTSAWGPWDTLSREMQGDLAREEYCLVREVGTLAEAEQPAAEQKVCRHKWELVDFDRLALKLTLYCSRCGDWKREYLA